MNFLKLSLRGCGVLIDRMLTEKYNIAKTSLFLTARKINHCCNIQDRLSGAVGSTGRVRIRIATVRDTGESES